MELRSLRPGSTRAALAALEQRVAELEADLAEARRQHVRLAELADIVSELLIPLASRDQDRIDDAIARYQGSL